MRGQMTGKGGNGMKILIATDCYLYSMNGISTSVVTLSAALLRLGHEVKILALSDGGRSFRSGDDYFIKSLPSLIYPDLRISLAGRDPLLDELALWAPDVIHVHTDGSANAMAVACMTTSETTNSSTLSKAL